MAHKKIIASAGVYGNAFGNGEKTEVMYAMDEHKPLTNKSSKGG
jgi:hypothetical protein